MSTQMFKLKDKNILVRMNILVMMTETMRMMKTETMGMMRTETMGIMRTKSK